MSQGRATAIAHPNIAFVKYWGDVDPDLHVPTSSSISMNLDGLHTITSVDFQADRTRDELTIDGAPAEEEARRRVAAHLDRLRARAGATQHALVSSRSNFPAGTGLASSASAFAALTVAAAAALDLTLDTRQASALARLGSGSACRSIPPGFVEWVAGEGHTTSVAHSIAPPDHWALRDCIAIVTTTHKTVGSSEGKRRARSSPLNAARLAGAEARVAACREAILARDLTRLGQVAEADAVMMHAVAMTSQPPIHYWTPTSLRVIRAVVAWRAADLPVYYTADAGANIHCLCERDRAAEVVRRLEDLAGVREVRITAPGQGARRATA